MRKPHNVVIQKPDGGIEFYKLKGWLRANPQFLPMGMDPGTSTSHELRRALRSQGWGLEDRPDQVLVIKPNDRGETTFVGPVMDTDPEEPADMEEEEVTFGLERDLQSALRANISQLEQGMTISDDGKERITEAGRIDITATDSTGKLVVIELKAGTAQPDVIAQVLAYMGALGESDGRDVRGILVAGDFHKRVILAARAIPNLALRRYSFQFRFEMVK
jgi:RecB family endonuclease NucS